MIEAVIWDFGGVLTTSPFEAFTRFEQERGFPVDIIRNTNAANHLENAWAKFERAHRCRGVRQIIRGRIARLRRRGPRQRSAAAAAR